MPLTNPVLPNWTEADITINGTKLSFGQAMALRVAATDFHKQMAQLDALGSDENGRGIAKGYSDRLAEVLALMIGDRKR